MKALPAGSTVDFRSPTAWETYRWQILLVCAVVILQGGLIGRLVFERHRRQRAEIETKERIAELAHFNRYSTAGELTATIAHEINQPLGSILTNTETAELMLSSASPDIGELKEILADIRRDDERASEVIRRLRSLLKKAPFEAREIDLKEPIRDAVDLLLPRVGERDIVLRTGFPADPTLDQRRPHSVQQVIINLILNGMDAVLEQPAGERRIAIIVAAAGDMAEVSIADTGHGVPGQDAKKIFDSFFSTKKEGMGMGLSIVRTIVTAHGGHISVENGKDGRGATFLITLPLLKPA